jgi:hypothetical protein
VKNLPGGDGAVLVRTDLTDQAAWQELCAAVRDDAAEGLLAGLRIVDEPDYRGLSVQRLLTLVPEDAGYPYIAVADRFSAGPVERPGDRTVLIAGVDGVQLRAAVAQLAAIDANLCSANMDLSDYAEAVGEDSVYRGFPPPVAEQASMPQVDGPALTELPPGGILRLGTISSASGEFILVNQPDGDVVIYRRADGAPVWRTDTLLSAELQGLPNRMVLQDGGNLVLFEATGIPRWSSQTSGRSVQRALVSDDGRLVLVDADGNEVWSSGDRGH